MREPSDSAASAGDVLDSVGVRWALAGALAALRYRATPRLTTDADLLIGTHEGVADAFRSAGYSVTEIADQGEQPHVITVRGRGDRVDLLIAVVEYQQVALARAIGNVLTVEDVIVHKLIAWRPRDRDDIASILDTGIDFDEDYVSEWAAAWSVDDRWREAIRRR